MDAPVSVITDHTDVLAVMKEVRPTAVDPAHYELFNLFEVWYFRVTEVVTTNRLEWKSNDMPCPMPQSKISLPDDSDGTEHGSNILAYLKPSWN